MAAVLHTRAFTAFVAIFIFCYASSSFLTVSWTTPAQDKPAMASQGQSSQGQSAIVDFHDAVLDGDLDRASRLIQGGVDVSALAEGGGVHGPPLFSLARQRDDAQDAPRLGRSGHAGDR